MKIARFFTNSCGFLLLSGALALFISNWASADLTQPQDPLFEIPRRTVFWIVGGLAAVVGLICLFGEQPSFQATWVAWLATSIALYAGGFLWSVGPHFNVLFGTLPETFALSVGATRLIAEVVLAYLLAGSYGLLLGLWWRARTRPRAEDGTDFLKISCLHCGGHIAFPADGVGRQTACPHCGRMISLQPT